MADVTQATGSVMAAQQANMERVEVVVGDITRLEVDAIVNAANSSLRGGGGVDGAIHRAAGPRLKDESSRLAPCPTGEARITGGYDLPARHVIHTVGPVWHGGNQGEPELLANCYRNCFALAEKHGVKSIAFPAISTGVYGYPLEQAARVAVRETRRYLAGEPKLEHIVFACFDRRNEQAYREALAGESQGAGA